jgi:hypothetical protein
MQMSQEKFNICGRCGDVARDHGSDVSNAGDAKRQPPISKLVCTVNNTLPCYEPSAISLVSFSFSCSVCWPSKT